jgi:hypothetical protein
MAEKKNSKSKPKRRGTGRYYSSDAIRRGYESSQMPAASSEVMREMSPFGKYSPRAALTDIFSGAVDLFRDDEERAGANMGRQAAKKKVKRNMSRPDFKFKKGGKVRGCGKATRGVRAAKMVKMKGA